MNDAEVGTDRQERQEKEQFVDVVTEDMKLLGVTEEDADERVHRLWPRFVQKLVLENQ